MRSRSRPRRRGKAARERTAHSAFMSQRRPSRCRAHSAVSARRARASAAVEPTTSMSCGAELLLQVGRRERGADLALEQVRDRVRHAGRAEQHEIGLELEIRDSRPRPSSARPAPARSASVAEIASPFSLPSRTCWITPAVATKPAFTCPASRSITSGALPRYGTCTVSKPAIRAEILHRQMAAAAGTGMGVGERLLLRIGDELRDRVHRHGRMHDQHLAVAGRSEIGRRSLLQVERQLLVHRRIGGQRAGQDDQQRVAIGRGLRDRLGADIAAGAGAVLQDEGLLEASPTACRTPRARRDRADRRPRTARPP